MSERPRKRPPDEVRDGEPDPRPRARLLDERERLLRLYRRLSAHSALSERDRLRYADAYRRRLLSGRPRSEHTTTVTAALREALELKDVEMTPSEEKLFSERARLFLDLLELGLKGGSAAEPAIVAASQSRDPSLGARFHLLAAYLESGLRFGQALDKVPRLLPPQVNAMLKAGEETGDVLRVLPACRQLLNDGFSQTRGAMNYVVLVFLTLTPAAPAIFQVLSTFVFPRFLLILREMEVAPPAFTAYLINRAGPLAWVMSGTALLIYLAGIVYIGGPRLTGWLQSGPLPFCDWLAYRLPWRRKRMQRDFAALLVILLDKEVPEERAVTLAAAGTRTQMSATTRKTTTGQIPVPMKLNCSERPETGWPLVYHLEMPRAETIMPSVVRPAATSGTAAAGRRLPSRTPSGN